MLCVNGFEQSYVTLNDKIFRLYIKTNFEVQIY